MNEPYRLRYTNQIVGIFLLLLLFSTIVIGVILTRASGYFVEPELFQLTLPQAEVGELQMGTEVMQLGKRIGQVRDLQYVDESDLVEITLAIEPEFKNAIDADSEVTIQRKFGLGVPVLKVRRRSKATTKRTADQQQKEIARRNIATFTGEVDRIEQMATEVEKVRVAIQRIQGKLEPTLDKIGMTSDRTTRSFETAIDPAMISVQKTSEEVRPKTVATLDQIRSTTSRLEGKVNQLTDRMETLIDDDIAVTVRAIKESADAATRAADSVAVTSQQVDKSREQTTEEVSETLRVLRETAELVQNLANETREIVRIVRREAEDLPGTTERVNDTVSETQDLVGEIRGHWLLRRYRDSTSSSEQVSPTSVRAGASR